MRRIGLRPPWPRRPPVRPPPTRFYSLPAAARRQETVVVPVGSAACVTIDLFNDARDALQRPLLVHLPALPSDALPAALPAGPDAPAPVPAPAPGRAPDFLAHLPLASINYTWHCDPTAPLRWPAPIFSAANAFAWILRNLAPPQGSTRDIFIYASHLGASLATSLALTEAHPGFGVRGLVAYNGIYNWTMFLPDHSINKRRSKFGTAPRLPEPSHLHTLQCNLPGLFVKPEDLFDPFASPSLFFHSPGLLPPHSFSMSARDAAMIDALVGDADAAAAIPKAPRKSYLGFPPRGSALTIPQILLLHDAPRRRAKSPRGSSKSGQGSKGTATSGHSLAAQAKELAELVKRNIVVETKGRSEWDDEAGGDDQIQQRVRVVEVGAETDSLQLDEAGQDAALEWLQDRM